MHAVQSALAIRRERERRQSLKKTSGRKGSGASLPGGGLGALPSATGIPADFRSSEKSNGTFNYITVGIAFIIFGSLMLVPIFAGGSQMIGLDWHHLLGIGGLLIAVGVLMIVVHILTEDDEPSVVEKTMEKYKSKMTRSGSQNPIIEDVEYGIDSRRSSMAQPNQRSNESDQSPNQPDLAKNFEHELSGVVKV